MVSLFFQHFRLALWDNSPCTLTKFEIRFHIAHVFELQGKHNTAKDTYEELLAAPDIPSTVKANTLRQLGKSMDFGSLITVTAI